MKSLKEIRRWATLRCAHCGHRFRWSRDARHATSNRDGKVYHGPCLGYIQWRAKAEDRLTVFGVVVDMAGISDRLVTGVVELRAETEDERVASSNRVFRVFYDLSKRRPAPEPTGEEN